MIIRTNQRVHSENYILKVLRSKDVNLKVAKIDKIYYPYAIMVYRIQMKNPKSNMNRKIMCVVDMVTGRCAVGKDDPILVEAEVDDIMLLESQIEAKEIYEKSREFVFKVLMGKVKVLYVPGLALEEEEYFHKLFYIVHCKNNMEEDYFLLADPMDASFTVLDY